MYLIIFPLMKNNSRNSYEVEFKLTQIQNAKY